LVAGTDPVRLVKPAFNVDINSDHLF